MQRSVENFIYSVTSEGGVRMERKERTRMNLLACHAYAWSGRPFHVHPNLVRHFTSCYFVLHFCNLHFLHLDISKGWFIILRHAFLSQLLELSTYIPTLFISFRDYCPSNTRIQLHEYNFSFTAQILFHID